MADWITVGNADDIKPGSWRIVELADYTEVAVFNLDGEFYAIQDICTHDGGALVGGQIDGCDIICPRHGARFCIKTGAVKAPPAYEAVDTFEVRVKDGVVELNDSSL